MPVFRSGKGLAPAWCELEYFEIVRLQRGEARVLERVGPQEKLIVCEGECRIAANGELFEGRAGQTNLDLNAGTGAFEITEVSADALLVRMCGRWGSEVGGSGLFFVVKSETPDTGNPLIREAKNTSFDNHYHDCDEYWIIFDGRGVAASEGKLYQVGVGDCVATGRGHHHDFPVVYEPGRAVFFETTMEGAKRPGHLWEHTHGPAQPVADRI